MVQCPTLNKDELVKQSIYILDDDSDKDFEFYVFCDPDDKTKRPDFLKELFNIIDNEGNSFAVKKHEEELKRWIGANDGDALLTPLNWLKIAIERYPYRLIVITDKNINNNIPLFIKKRICFLQKDSKCNDVIELYFSYIDFLKKNRINTDISQIFYFFYDAAEASAPYYPPTLPPIFRLTEINESEDTPNIIIDIYKKECLSGNIDLYNNNGNENKAYLGIYLSRHVGLYDLNSNGWTGPDYIKPNLIYIYSEALSGALSYTYQLYSAKDILSKNKNNFAAGWLFLKFTEQALLRVGICDERFQGWWANLSEKDAGNIFQSRLSPVYLEDQIKYGQFKYPDKFYLKLIKNESSEWKTEFITEKQDNQNGSDKLWPDNDRTIDVLIIHQGILDKWKEYNKSAEELTREILGLKEKIPFIIITSGRGRPDNVPYGTKFLSFSNIESCIVGNYFERFTLMRQIMNIKEKL